MQKEYIFFQNATFGESSLVYVLMNEGMFSDICKALKLYHETFGITDGLEKLQSVWFKNGYYEFVFLPSDAIYKDWKHLVRFVLSIDWDAPFGLAQVGDVTYQVSNAIFEQADHALYRIIEK
jgi:hypothetical protein